MFDPETQNDAIVSAVSRVVSEHQSGVYRLVGVSFSALAHRRSELSLSAEQNGITLFFVTDETEELTGLIRSATQRAHALGIMDDSLLEMADAGLSSKDAQFRFWSELTNKFRHSLIVCTEQVPGWIGEFAQRCYSDPIAEIDPEFASADSTGAIFVVGQIEGVEIDCSLAAKEVVRDTLQNDAIIERIAATTGGDIDAVSHFVEHLESHQQSINYVRYQSATTHEQRLVEVLAIANSSIDTTILQSVALGKMDPDEFGRAFRKLIEEGLITRLIRDGQVQIALRDGTIRTKVLEGVSNADQSEIHVALGEAELGQSLHIPDPVFVSRHFVAAKDPRAISFVLQAVPLLAARGQIDDALSQLSAVRDEAAGPQKQTIAAEIVDLLERSGDFVGAIRASESYIEQYPSDPNSNLKLAKLYYRTGQLKKASELLSKREGDDFDIELELLLADVAYGLGQHDQVEETIAKLLQNIDDADLSDAAKARATIGAKNALARVDFFRRQYDDAKAKWETNRAVATDWGWRKEVARAEVNLGVLAMELEQASDAKRRFEQALEIAELQHVVERACLVNLAMLCQRERSYSEALTYGLDAMRVAKRSGDISGFAIASRNLASVYSTLGAYERAQRMMTFLRDNYEFDGTTLNGAWNVLVDSEIAFDEQRFQDAIDGLEKLVDGNLSSIFKPRAILRSAYASLKLGNDKPAKAALKAHKKAESKEIDALAALVDAELSSNGKSRTKSIEKATLAIKMCQKHGKVADAVRARFLLATLLHEEGKTAEALEEIHKELRHAEEISRQVPEGLRDGFFRRPDYKQLVDLLRELQGVVPVVFELESREVPMMRSRYSKFVGEHEGLHRIFRVIDKVASSEATVLIYGESGTGKELVAEAMHRESERRHKPFVKVNCAALVEDLLLSELFGHEKGAFTGAVERKIGRFELADGGTIFLDEIGDISPNTQVALLRVLQEKTFERVGGSETQTVDVRVVCATNRNLEALVEQGVFRLDLYYRLKGVVIETPPLRERREDIGRLAQHFASNLESGTSKRMSESAIQELARYSWPGNIRELQNFIRSVVLFVDGDTIERRHIEDFKDFFVSGTIDRSLPSVKVDYLNEFSSLEEDTTPEGLPSTTTVVQGDLETALVERMIEGGESLANMKKKLEIECIKSALLKSGGNVTKAAEILKMKRPRLSQIIGDNAELAELKQKLIA